MEIFMLKLAVAVIPLILLVASASVLSTLPPGTPITHWPGTASAAKSCALWLRGRCCADT